VPPEAASWEVVRPHPFLEEKGAVQTGRPLVEWRVMLKRLRNLFGGGATTEFTTLRDPERPEAGPLIYMEGVSRVYRQDEVETWALRDVSLSIDRGEFVCIKGPSGSGKTTVLSIMGLLDMATDGVYRLNGMDVSRLGPGARAAARNREVGFVFQSFNLIGDLSVWENVELPLTYHGTSRNERHRRVEEALRRVDMLEQARSMPSQLAGGQQQRVGVARAVVADPEILLADEPTGSLNSDQAKAVMELLSELHAAGSTICLVSHDPRWRERAGRTLDLFDGVIDGLPG